MPIIGLCLFVATMTIWPVLTAESNSGINALVQCRIIQSFRLLAYDTMRWWWDIKKTGVAVWRRVGYAPDSIIAYVSLEANLRCQDPDHFSASFFNERFAEIEVLVYMSEIQVPCQPLIPMIHGIKKLFGFSFLADAIVEQ